MKKNAKTSARKTDTEIIEKTYALSGLARDNAQLAAGLLSQTMCTPEATMASVVTGDSRKLPEELLLKSLTALVAMTPRS